MLSFPYPAETLQSLYITTTDRSTPTSRSTLHFSASTSACCFTGKLVVHSALPCLIGNGTMANSSFFIKHRYTSTSFLSRVAMSEDNHTPGEVNPKTDSTDIANIFDDDFDGADLANESEKQHEVDEEEELQFDFDQPDGHKVAEEGSEEAQKAGDDISAEKEVAGDEIAGDDDIAGEELGDEQDNGEEKQDEDDQEFAADSGDDEDNVYSIKAHKLSNKKEVTQKKKVRRAPKNEAAASKPQVSRDSGRTESYEQAEGEYNEFNYENEDPTLRKRRLLEERMDLAMKSKGVKRRKADEDDLERMQDDRIDFLKDQMIKAANLDVEKNSQGQIATEKMKLLTTVTDIISRADLAISILDNNLLEAVRLWLEPLPDASMPAYQIQKELINSLELLPIKTDHLVASGIGKVLVFYQRSKRTEPSLKKVVDRLIGDWTRPILNKSDSYKDRTIKFHDYNKDKFANKLASSRKKTTEAKTLYEQNAERRKRAAIPSSRTTAYKIAPKVDASLLRRQYGRYGDDERFKRINQKITSMSQKKSVKKSGPSIEGRNLTM